MNRRPVKSPARNAKPDSKEAYRVKLITERIINLPTLPSVVAKMIELVDNPKTSAASLARLISTDQALTAKILKLANSPYYGFPREISTVNLAIVVLGFNTVKDIGLSITVLNAFKGRQESEHFDVTKFWEHCIACGVASRFLARVFRYGTVGEAFVAGLLHDVGKVVLNQYLDDEFKEIMKQVHEKDATLIEAERKVLGTTHAEVGGWLADRWNLPAPIANAIRLHHQPLEPVRQREIVLLVHFADFLVRMAGIGDSGNKLPPELLDNVREEMTKLGISSDAESLERMRMDLILELDKADAFFSILKEGSTDEA